MTEKQCARLLSGSQEHILRGCNSYFFRHTMTVTIEEKALKKIQLRTRHDKLLKTALDRCLDRVKQSPWHFGEALHKHPDHRKAKVNYRHRLIFIIEGPVIYVKDFDTRENIEKWY